MRVTQIVSAEYLFFSSEKFEKKKKTNWNLTRLFYLEIVLDAHKGFLSTSLTLNTKRFV